MNSRFGGLSLKLSSRELIPSDDNEPAVSKRLSLRLSEAGSLSSTGGRQRAMSRRLNLKSSQRSKESRRSSIFASMDNIMGNDGDGDDDDDTASLTEPSLSCGAGTAATTKTTTTKTGAPRMSLGSLLGAVNQSNNNKGATPPKGIVSRRGSSVSSQISLDPSFDDCGSVMSEPATSKMTAPRQRYRRRGSVTKFSMDDMTPSNDNEESDWNDDNASVTSALSIQSDAILRSSSSSPTAGKTSNMRELFARSRRPSSKKHQNQNNSSTRSTRSILENLQGVSSMNLETSQNDLEDSLRSGCVSSSARNTTRRDSMCSVGSASSSASSLRHDDHLTKTPSSRQRRYHRRGSVTQFHLAEEDQVGVHSQRDLQPQSFFSPSNTLSSKTSPQIITTIDDIQPPMRTVPPTPKTIDELALPMKLVASPAAVKKRRSKKDKKCSGQEKAKDDTKIKASSSSKSKKTKSSSSKSKKRPPRLASNDDDE